MTSFHDVAAEKLIPALADELRKIAPEVKPPSWAQFVKTGVGRERQPVQKDWWHVRAASMLRRIGLLGPIGTSKLSVHYGGRKNLGHAPDRFRPGSRNIIRKILQQLEKSGFVKQGAKGVHKGRMVTPKGHSLLNRAAAAILAQEGFTIPKPAPVPEQPEKPKRKATPKKPKAEQPHG